MNFGFNSNVSVGNAIYHVQTEDRGPAHPFLDTVVYLSGRVVYKRSTNYQQFAGDTDAAKLVHKLHERLAQQHREVIAELEAGTLEMHGNESARPAKEIAGASKDELDLRLTNPKNWFATGSVIFEIELCETISKRRVEGAEVQACIEQDRRRIPCAEVQTDAEGCATLKFSMPANVTDGSSLVIRATDGARFAQLRFTLKSKTQEKTPAPVS